MNYKIIIDEDELDRFIEFLPSLKKDEVYYISLFARKKYFKELKSDKSQLKSFVSTKQRLKSKIRQLQCELGSYTQDDIEIPQEALALYITPNSRSLIRATKNAIKTLLERVLNEYNGYNPHAIVMSELQTACGTKHFYDFDFDFVDLNETIEEIKKVLNIDACHFVTTRGGFHLLVELNLIDKQYQKTWYQGITKIKGCDVRGADGLLPVPGCTQGNSVPRLLNKSI